MLVVAASLVGSTATAVLALVAALVGLGVTMIFLTVWLVRSTRSDSASLGPLEVMGDRRFRRAGADGRASRLAAARAEDAPTPAPIVPFEDPPPGDAAPGSGGEDGSRGEAGRNGEAVAPTAVPASGRDPSLGGISPDPRDETRPGTHPAQMPDPEQMEPGEQAG